DGLIRIGPDVLITDDPEVVRKMNSARSPYKKDKWYTLFRADPYQHSMLSTDDDALHQDIRSKVMPGYSGREVPTMESDIDGQIANFKRFIRTKYLSTAACTKPMDFAAGVHFYALDVSTKLALGEEWGFMTADGDIDSFI